MIFHVQWNEWARMSSAQCQSTASWAHLECEKKKTEKKKHQKSPSKKSHEARALWGALSPSIDQQPNGTHNARDQTWSTNGGSDKAAHKSGTNLYRILNYSVNLQQQMLHAHDGKCEIVEVVSTEWVCVCVKKIGSFLFSPRKRNKICKMHRQVASSGRLPTVDSHAKLERAKEWRKWKGARGRESKRMIDSHKRQYSIRLK